MSAESEIPISTIGDTVRRFKFCRSTASLPRSGRPRKIPDRTTKNIVRKVKKDPRLTRSELHKDLESAETKVCKNTIIKILLGEGFHSRTLRKTHLLRPIHVKNRLHFAKDHLEKPAKLWDSCYYGLMRRRWNYLAGIVLVTFGGGRALHMIPRIPSQQ